MNRELDGVFFRIKRENKFENICFSDLTEDEKNEMMRNRTKDWIDSLSYHLITVYQEFTGISFLPFYDKLQDLNDLDLLKNFAKMMGRNLKDLGDTFDLVSDSVEEE